jgi:hypothetical protein
MGFAAAWLSAYAVQEIQKPSVCICRKRGCLKDCRRKQQRGLCLPFSKGEGGRSLGLIWLCFHAWGPKGQTGRQTGPGLRVLSGSGLVNFQSPWDLQKNSKALQPLPESHLLRQDNNRRERRRPVGFVNRDTPFISKGRLCAHNTQAGRLLLSSSA